MRKLLTTVGVTMGLLMVTVLAGPALGAAQKVPLEPAAAFPNNTGGGFVVFNNSAGPDNLHFTVALKGVLPDETYDIYLFVDDCDVSVDGFGNPSGTVTTNRQGNATLHVNTSVSLGTHALGIDVVYNGDLSGADQYLSDNFNYPCAVPGSATLTFA
jgi:hypothetical protein